MFLFAFAIALGTEVPVLYLTLHRRSSIHLIVITGIVGNVCTLPIVWFVLPLWLRGVAYVVASEMFAVFAECLIIRLALAVDFRTALLASTLMNLSSFLMGLVFLR